MSEPWPTGLPDSLWSYHLLTPEDRSYLPMMGVEFTPDFLYAFAFGVVFVMFFAWKRFQGKPNDTAGGYKVLAKIDARDLGGSYAMLRAYFIYVFALLVAYVSMTFFGKLILQTAQGIPLAGISVDMSALKFDSPQWPLTLAFGFAGLAPLLPPLAVAEDWLRNRAYRAVGIPVRIEQTTRNIVTNLEAASRRPRSDQGAADSLSEELGKRKDHLQQQVKDSAWAEAILAARAARKEDLLNSCTQLELLVEWAKTSRGAWPGPEVSRKVRDLETELVSEADKLLTSFQQRLLERPAAEDDKSGKAAPQQERLSLYLTETIENARRIRDEFAILLAIYLERDPDDPAKATKRHDRALSDLLRRTDPPNRAGVGPEAGVLFCLVPVFLLYAIGAWKGFHTLLVSTAPQDDPRTVLMTAGTDTLRIAAVAWLPLLAAFSLRQYLSDTRDWVVRSSKDGARYYSHRSAAVVLGLGAALLGLCGVAMLCAFGIAETAARFRELLFKGYAPFILYYPSQAIYSIPIIIFCLWSADARAKGRSGLLQAFLGAVAVLGFVALYFYFWNGNPCIRGKIVLLDFFEPGCLRAYNGLDFLILPAITFLAGAVFGNQPGNGRQAGRPPRLPRASKAKLVGITSAALLLSASGAFGQTSPGQDPEAVVPQRVVLGFRADVEPFSYATGGKARDVSGDSQHRFVGYIADLCYAIFDGSKYRIEAVEVTAGNRFRMLRQRDNPDAAQKVDVLCDPVTMRFSDPDRSEVGIFSPIIFASGVSYFEKVTRKAGELYIGFVAGTTAAKVARRACMIDLFRVLSPDQRTGLYGRCEFAWQVATVHSVLLLARQAVVSGDVEFEMDPTSARNPNNPRVLIAALNESKGKIAAAKRLMKRDPYLERTKTSVLEYIGIMRYIIEGSLNNNSIKKPKKAEIALLILDSALRLTSDCDAPAYGNRAPPGAIPSIHFCAKSSHAEMIEWFCGPGSENRKLVYMGDRELIRGKLMTWEDSGNRCGVERPDGADTLTYEPYALLVTPTKPELVQFVQRRVYEFFSDRPGANSLFAKYFPGRAMSPPLAYLFLLNAVEDENQFNPELQSDP